MTIVRNLLAAFLVSGLWLPALAFDVPAQDAARELGPSDAKYDHRFIDAMIPHHEKAIAMAKDAEKKAKKPEIRRMAQNIIKAQQREIAQLKRWRQQWFAETR